jgi:tetratricopeptide (TPR) repeat protein
LRADIAVQDGRFAEAVRVNPLHTGARMAAAVDRLLAGGASSLSSEKRGLLEEARGRFLDLLRLTPRDIDALLGLASVETAWASGLDPAHFRDAETWWRRALVLDPNNRFLAERHARELPAAIASTLVRLEAEAQVRPADAGTRVDLAYAYLARGESSMARETAGEALRLDPSNDRAGTLLERLP